MNKISLLNVPSRTFPDKSTNTFENLPRIPPFYRCSRDAPQMPSVHTSQYIQCSACTDVELACNSHASLNYPPRHARTQTERQHRRPPAVTWVGFLRFQSDATWSNRPSPWQTGSTSTLRREREDMHLPSPATALSNRPADVTQNPWRCPDSQSK